ncbi:MAG TPA: hypothetical protein VEH84_01345 [Alphaproteobacteria bacterium]|nr:hypothetical protein [Alphaproteobacteria bacterium]
MRAALVLVLACTLSGAALAAPAKSKGKAPAEPEPPPIEAAEIERALRDGCIVLPAGVVVRAYASTNGPPTHCADADARAQDILAAASRLIAEGGLRDRTLRARDFVYRPSTAPVPTLPAASPQALAALAAYFQATDVVFIGRVEAPHFLFGG